MIIGFKSKPLPQVLDRNRNPINLTENEINKARERMKVYNDDTFVFDYPDRTVIHHPRRSQVITIPKE